jgi:hypothetical protein
MVSGWVTSPFELSRIDSGEAKLMVTLEKSLLSFLFLIFTKVGFYPHFCK